LRRVLLALAEALRRGAPVRRYRGEGWHVASRSVEVCVAWSNRTVNDPLCLCRRNRRYVRCAFPLSILHRQGVQTSRPPPRCGTDATLRDAIVAGTAKQRIGGPAGRRHAKGGEPWGAVFGRWSCGPMSPRSVESLSFSRASAACNPPPGSYASDITPSCTAGTYNSPINRNATCTGRR
jgi:hypothetical protein